MERGDLIQKLATANLSGNDFKQILEFADSLADAGLDYERWRAAELRRQIPPTAAGDDAGDAGDVSGMTSVS